MVCTDSEALSYEIMSEVFNEHHNSKQFPIGCAVPSLGVI